MGNLGQRCTEVERLIGHTFDAIELLEEALVSAGTAQYVGNGRLTHAGNTSLAFIGDTLMKLAIGIQCREEHATKGETQDRVQQRTSNRRLADLSDEIGLSVLIIGAPGARVVMAPGPKATAMEAVIGAVYLDAGQEAAFEVLRRIGLL